MKKLCLLFSLCPVFLWGQVKFDFENGLPVNMEQFPLARWDVNSEDPLEDDFSLRHSYDNSTAGRDAVSFEIPEPNPDSLMSWDFVIHYSCKPSSVNNWSFYLLSDGNAEAMITDDSNIALMLGVNQKGNNDSLCLYLQEEKKLSTLLVCDLNVETDIFDQPWQFSLVMDPSSTLTVKAGPYNGELIQIGKITNFQLPAFYPSFMGIGYSYTSSRDRLLAIDMISFESSNLNDKTAPVLDSIYVKSPGIIEFRFNEDIQISGNLFDIDWNYAVDTTYSLTQSLIVQISDPPGNNELINFRIEGLFDRHGNTKTYKGYFNYYYPGWHDIIFTEILADPYPAVYLPEFEFVEILNRSENPISLKNWRLSAGSKEWVLPEIILSSGEYHIFTSMSDSASVIVSDGKKTHLFDSRAVLNNSGQEIVIYTPEKLLIDAVNYSDSWYNDDTKNQGGWSLERIDTGNLCGGNEIWKASSDTRGGTPGKENSYSVTILDTNPPFVHQVIYESDSRFKLLFNEPIDRELFSPADFYLMNPGINEAELLKPFYDECLVKPGMTTVNDPVVIRNNWRDCSGNISDGTDSVLLSPPEMLLQGMVIITEVLFSPWAGCPEFIEIYNNSAKVLNLYDVKLIISGMEDEAEGGVFLTSENLLFYPETFLVISKDPTSITRYYDIPGKYKYLTFSDLPPLPDKGGRIALRTRSGKLIDEMLYSDSGQFPLIKDSHGVSLERVHLDISPGIQSEWHSASTISGSATPGYINSQNITAGENSGHFICEYEVFSPDNDGYRDLAVLKIKMEKAGYFARVRIFDASGRIIRTLAANELLGTEETLFWDGRNKEGGMAASGIYLFHMEACHLSGIKKVFKETVVLKSR